MKFSLFKKTKVENGIDLDLQVLLPKSGKSISLGQLIQNAYEKDQDPAIEKKISTKKNVSGESEDDKSGESAKHHTMANLEHMVKMHDGSHMKIKDVLHKYKQMADSMKHENDEMKELDVKAEPHDVEAEGDLHNRDEHSADEWSMDEHEAEVAKEEHKMELHDDLLEEPQQVVHDEEEPSHEEHESGMMKAAKDPQEDVKAKDKALELAEHEEKEIAEAKKKQKMVKKNTFSEHPAAKRLKLANEKAWADEARLTNEFSGQVVDLSFDKVQRGKARYGSG